MQAQAHEVARCIAQGTTESQIMPLDETVSIMQVLDVVREQLGVVYPGELA